MIAAGLDHTPLARFDGCPGTATPITVPTFFAAPAFIREIEWRRERNRELDPQVRYKLPAWGELEVYET